MDTQKKLLSRFPKQRPELPSRYRDIYIEHYRRNRDGSSPATSVAKRMEAWMHRKVAEDTFKRPADYTTLEIGGGTLNHIDYEPRSTVYDVVEPFVELYRNSPQRTRVAHFHKAPPEISNGHYDRIVSIATFEHLCDLPTIVAQCGLLLEPTGELRVAVPSEGTILWALGWRLTTGIEFRLRHGLNYGVLMRHEHVNTAAEIASVLRLFFGSVRRSLFGIVPALSFYQFFQCREPNRPRCADYLSSLALMT